MRDRIIAGVRTTVQTALAGGSAALAATLLDKGVELDLSWLPLAGAAVAVGLTTMVLNWLEQKVPAVTKILSLGLSTSTPTYR